MVLGCLENTTEPYGTNMFVKKLFLPRLSNHIIDQIYESIEHNTNSWDKTDIPPEYDKFKMYNWMPANDIIQDWCRSYISPDLYWGVQVINSDLPMHKDYGTEIKFNYLIDTGGDQSITNYHDDQGNLLDSYVLKSHTWYILDVSTNHSVSNIEKNRLRISLTSRIKP
jgi:hypothetical protein